MRAGQVLALLVFVSAQFFPITAASDTVKVLYAGSLAHVMQKAIRPAFEKATGDQFQGFAAGSSKLASEIKGGIRHGDVFISAHPSVNRQLLGSGDAGYIDWYATFMKSPLVIGYNPKSHFSNALQSQPWYRVLTRPGVKAGRTDPQLDPKGELTVKAARQIATKKNQPKLEQQLLERAKVYPEQDLIGRLQSGQIDAGFFYAGEAAAADIPTVTIEPAHIGARYTITILDHAPHKAAASAFINFLLSKQGKRILRNNGFNLIQPPSISGDKSAMPSLNSVPATR
ncbi:extracellular solute-binding protein [Salinisphaera sp. USBA-960]|uniref:extracellular solute-binding protein n=1 Tax=Salinisphaera orenii TaxID=856731 RepID=UPI000DBE7B48|nr:extracellular solute-binding protein [Salifodinibacter halophilus]NNC25502.1 extracellular solute-binding protein [Salifodinibacter halophilus]